MNDSIDTVRSAFPDYGYTLSFSFQYDDWAEEDVSALDFLELHIWMEQFSDFMDELGVPAAKEETYLDSLASEGGRLYRRDPTRWRNDLQDGIDFAIEWSKASGKPLVTTESWAVILARDWPRLDWSWIKALCEYGVRNSVESGRWVGISTSNFCGPQFVGMWDDTGWHREMTALIDDGPVYV